MGSIDREIERMNSYHSELTAYCDEMFSRQPKWKLEELAELRKLPLETLIEHKIFWVGSMAEMMLPDYMDRLAEFGLISETNNKPIFHDRWVMPIRTQDGLVQNLVGYSPDFDERYVYGTGAYYRRTETFWGLENMGIAYTLGWAIVVEGITDALRLRSLGLRNSLARCGTFKSERLMRTLDRLRYGVIFIHDRDSAGDQTRKHWKTAKCIRLNTMLTYKDSDEMLRDDINVPGFMAALELAANKLMEREHSGEQQLELEPITMV